MQAKYKDKSRNGLKNGHEYIVKFSKPTGQYVYDCNVIFDVTEKEDMNILLKYASQISIQYSWDIDKLEMED